MPLVLNVPETDRSQVVVWDPTDAAQAADAAAEIAQLQQSGFIIQQAENGRVLASQPALAAHLHVFRILSVNGDDRLLWDRRDPKQVAEARREFESYLAKGYKAYSVRMDGSRGSRLDNFDALLEEVLVQESLLVPRTIAG